MKLHAAALCLLLAAITTDFLHGQNYVYAIGNPTFSTQIPIEDGYILVNNGEIHLDIPLAAQTQRGRIPLVENLEYDSRIWQITSNLTWQPTNVPNSMGGWRLVTNNTSTQESPTYDTLVTQYGSCGPGQEQLPTEELIYNFAWTDPNGTNHQFDAAFTQNLAIPCQQVQGASTSGAAVDGSGYSLSATYDPNSGGIDFVITDVNGNEVYPTVQDTNGNYYSSDSNGNLIDTLGRTPVRTTTSGNQITYSVLGWNGTYNPYTVTTETIYYNTAFGESAVSEASGSFTAIQSIQLPDGSTYQFTYDSGTSSGHYGELMSVTLPSGGVIQYTWQNFLDSFNNENRWLKTRVKDDGTTRFQPATISHCSGSSGCEEQTTITDPSQNDTVYKFTLNPGTDMNASSFNTQVTEYQGTSGSGTQLESVATNYTYGTTSLDFPGGGGETFIVPQTQTVQTTLPAVGLTAQTVTTLNSTGALPTCIQNWDYYSGSAPSNPTIQTSYAYYGGSGLPTAIEVMDGAGSGACTGNEISETTYGYDQTTASPISGLPNHADVTVSGNLTTMSQWINTSNSSITTTATYDTAGTLLTKTDPNGTTTYSYDTTDTYATGITPPTPSSGISLGSSRTVDFSSGLLASTTDPNGAQTFYKNYDFLGRVGEIDQPDGGKSTFGYSPADGYATTATESHTYQYQNASTYANTETLYDSYGRIIRSAVANGQSSNPWYEQDTCYNNVGQANFNSYSYQAASLTGAEVCSGAGDTFAYDAMGRVTSVQHSDNTYVLSSYTGRATKTTDEYGIGRITQTDGLGRTTAVCEIAPNDLPNSQAPPGSCGLDIAATGFLTTYAYDLQGHQTTVTQGSQTRVFQTDSLGRPVSQQEPESGTTGYSYTYNSTGLQVVRTRPQADVLPVSSAGTTNTTTQYDVLGRPLSISYSDGITPTRNYSYDVAQVWGITLSNPKGRLVLAWNTANTGSIYGYDAMGRVTLIDQCTPSNCGTSYFPTAYGYDWTGNLLSATDGTNVTTSYTYSPANEVLTIMNSPYDFTHPQSLVSNVVNGPFGPLNWQLGNGLCGAHQYDTMGRTTGGGVYSGSTPPNCSSGTSLYAFSSGYTGSYLTSASDSILAQNNSYGYDELGRLNSLTVNSGNPGSFLYWFDRWGNRVYQQVTSGSGPQPTYSFSNNQIQGGNCATLNATQICYDAAGNEVSDGNTTYAYDADGNVITEGTTELVYDALNQQVRQTYSSSAATEVVFGVNGQLASLWWVGGPQIMGKAYWGGMPLESYQVGANAAYFQHFDWNLNKRLTTTYSGSVYGEDAQLPFGDGFYGVMGHRDNTFDDYGGLWDNGSTMHAQYREYSDMEGRWMQPDPYGGSYDFSNPQSFNRYGYTLNNPLSFTDPTGQFTEGPAAYIGTSICGPECGAIAAIAAGVAELLKGLFGFGGPHFHGSLKPRPSTTGNPDWDGNFGESLGISTKIPQGDWGIAAALGLPSAGCEFGACDDMGTRFMQGGAVAAAAGWCGEYPRICSLGADLGALKAFLSRAVPAATATAMLLSMTGDADPRQVECDERRDAEEARCWAKYGLGSPGGGGNGKYGNNPGRRACLQRVEARWNACLRGMPDPGPPFARLKDILPTDADDKDFFSFNPIDGSTKMEISHGGF